ncbi:hypothetical protein K2173_013806 [Erythroxylum novogranatense]|uniref:Uncharacterized protein n=1 Tax=Erythroxylum novogranatense TaxID=1862640 RepID=A0AAV8SCE3_9ROSI|nr:hypothetical protein K2173_013806 [Erythroxylum novogranatense]
MDGLRGERVNLRRDEPFLIRCGEPHRSCSPRRASFHAATSDSKTPRGTVGTTFLRILLGLPGGSSEVQIMTVVTGVVNVFQSLKLNATGLRAQRNSEPQAHRIRAFRPNVFQSHRLLC